MLFKYFNTLYHHLSRLRRTETTPDKGIKSANPLIFSPKFAIISLAKEGMPKTRPSEESKMPTKLYFKYVYTFYSFNEEMASDIFEQAVEINTGCRFTLHDQEDGSFVVSELKKDHIGYYVILTFPGKDNLVIHEGEVAELAYDEYYSAMGDDNHNVYEGTITLG